MLSLNNADPWTLLLLGVIIGMILMASMLKGGPR